jgi:hypothetical protein
MSMILYNIRYRGPYEYEKFILNVFQTSNEIKRISGELSDTNYKDLRQQLDQVNEYLNQVTGEDCIAQKVLMTRLQVQ